jgi:hypothetical protein
MITSSYQCFILLLYVIIVPSKLPKNDTSLVLEKVSRDTFCQGWSRVFTSRGRINPSFFQTAVESDLFSLSSLLSIIRLLLRAHWYFLSPPCNAALLPIWYITTSGPGLADTVIFVDSHDHEFCESLLSLNSHRKNTTTSLTIHTTLSRTALRLPLIVVICVDLF